MKNIFEKRCSAIVLVQFFMLNGLLASDYPITTYLGIEQGLSNNSVRCIYRDHRGFMWFGTYDGLNRYDGYEFRIFRNNFKNSASLVNNWINTIDEDKNGNIWVGTRQGACIYRNLTGDFSPVYYWESRDKKNKVTSVIKDIERDEQGNMFLATENMGLLFCPKGDSVAVQLPVDKEPVHFKNFEVPSIKIGTDKRVWVFVRHKGLFLYDYKLKKLRLVNANIPTGNCLEIAGNVLWIGTSHGLFKYNITTKACEKAYDTPGKKLILEDIRVLALDRHNRLWIGTDGGINIVRTETGQIDFLFSDNHPYSLTSNAVYAFLEDPESRIWIGTLRGGINIIDPHKRRFRTISSEPATNNTLISNYIFALHETSEGDIWVGTEGGGISVWNRQTNKFTNYKHNPIDPGSLSHDFITDIKGDHLDNIWIATYKSGVSRFNKATQKFEHFRFIAPNNSWKITNPQSFVLLADRQRDLWVGSLQQGLYKLDQHQQVFLSFDPTVKNIFELIEDKNGALWAGALKHLIQIDKKNKKHVFHDIGNPVRSIFEDKSGNLWLGTEGGGLLLFDRKQQMIKARYTTDEGLCSNNVLNILEDEGGNLWISTFNCISRFHAKTGIFKNYYQSDGLQSNQFNYNAALKLRTGELVFGGIKGFTLFHPKSIHPFKSAPNIFLTDIEVGNLPLEHQASFITKASSNSIEKIKIPYDQAILSFRFAALEYSAPDKVQYAYYLQGWDRGWNYKGHNRNATYTRLSEGTYTLRVKCTNAEGVWGKDELRLTIVVLPPWYRAWWAYLLYTALIGCLVYYYLQYRAKQTRLQYEVKIAKLNAENERAERERSLAELQKEKMEREMSQAELALEKAELEKERAQREWEQAEREKERIIIEKEREMNEKKLSFFTNISHEFRTPLTLIINPIKDLLHKKNSGQPIRQDSELNIVYRNARRMLSLVDQLLLFRKAESGLDKIKPSRLNASNLAREVYLCFIHQAKVKNIDYVFESNKDQIEIYADRVKLEIILYNLLSNAIKYTPDGGSIRFAIKDEQEHVMIAVQDTGAGIPKETGDMLFEKFYQAERRITHTQPGFGIGLFLVKHFTEQHKGIVSYKSEEGKGATFSLLLPKGKEHFGQDVIVSENESGPVLLEEIKEEPIMDSPEPTEITEPISDVVTEKQTLLIVEDDEQIRQYLHQLFKNQYIIYQAENGEKGLEQAQNYLPDLIISDIHMQGMSGIDLCRHIKENEALNHIPVILLTASSSDELKLQCVEGGADDYIRKPFDNQLLIARISNLLKSRNNLQKYFYNEITLHKSNLKISPEYKEFLEKCISVVENHLEDENFTVKTLLSEMGMSHSNLFRKVKSVSGLSVNVFIRFIRLRKAADLFITTDHNVNETAFMVGIRDVKYFREQFNKLFKMNPSEYIKKYRKVYRNQFSVNKDSIDPNQLN